MNLKEFVTETIVQIMEGVQEAQNQVGDKGIVNPRSYQSGTFFVDTPPQPNELRPAEFDVAVTASSGSEAKGGAGLLVAAIGMGVQDTQSEGNTAISRIRFELPIAYPTHQVPVHR